MKTVSHLANNLNIGINVINRIIKKERIVNCAPSDGKRLINEYQEEIIQESLILEGYLDCFTLESKMNDVPEQEPFIEFKRRTYSNYNK